MSGSVPPPVIAPAAPLRRSLNGTTLSSGALLAIGAVAAYFVFAPAKPPTNPDAWNGNPRATNDVSRQVLPEPPAPQIAPESITYAPARSFVVPPDVLPEPVVASTFAGPAQMVTRHSAPPRTEQAAAHVASPVVARGGVTYEMPQIKGAEAVAVDDLERVLKPFTSIPCTLSVAIDGNRGGYFRCIISRPVRSWGGNTYLLLAGDEISGTYQSLTTGDKRMTAAAAIATTRRGDVAMMVPLSAAPVTDSLGRGGMDGYVAQRSWLERLGNALLVDGAATAARFPQQMLRDQVGSGMSINTRDTEQSVARSVDSTVNQAPIFRKNQGEEIGVLTTSPVRFPISFEVVR